MEDFDEKHNIINGNYPPICLLKAKYKQTFAYSTLHERIPGIYSNLIDEISRYEDEIAQEYGELSRDELHSALKKIRQLIDELQNDEPLKLFNGSECDKDLWNNFINSLPKNERTYFSTCWLWAECYLYRRLYSIFEATKYLKDYDYFRSYKRLALNGSVDVMKILLQKTEPLFNDNSNVEEDFKKFLHLGLWGNRCDLSLSDGQEVKQSGNQLNVIETLKPLILDDQTNDIWNLLAQPYTGERVIDIVFDNAGYELFTDLLLADYILQKGIATKIQFHSKAIPWFMSDTTPSDFHWTLQFLREHELEELSAVGKRWTKYVEQDKFSLLKPHRFWVSPYAFYRMKEIAPDLYKSLGDAYLVIIKGDLNYRKLLGDFSWPYTESFEVCLRGFHPTNTCSLRTIKADLICGLQPGVAESLFEIEPKWMLTGKYATIQLYTAKE